MRINQPRNQSTASVENVLESSVASTVSALLGQKLERELVGLAAAGINPAVLVLGLLGRETDSDLVTTAPAFPFPEAAKRKVVEDEDEDDDEEDDDEADDEEEDEDDEDEEVDDDEEEDEDDEDEEEEDDEFDDPDDDDDFDDDDDEDDFDDDE